MMNQRIWIVACMVLAWTCTATAEPLYVSPQGNDRHHGRTPEAAVRTLDRAARLLHDGDELLLQRGGEYDTLRLRSASNITVRPYGDPEKPKPIIRARNGIVGPIRNTYTNIVFEDLHLIGDHADDGFYWLARTDGLTLRRLRIENFKINIVIQGARQRLIHNVRIENCLILDSLHPSAHSHGVYTNYVRGLTMDGNLIDRNGRREREAGTIFNHAVYAQINTTDIVFTNNVSSRNFADGGQLRSGGIVRGNVSIQNPIGFDIGAVRGGSRPISGGIDLIFEDNLIYATCDISADQLRGIGVMFGNIRSLQMHRNTFAFCANTPGGRNTAIRYDDVSDVRFERYSAANNIAQGYDRFIRDATEQGKDFGLREASHLQQRDVDDWLDEARQPGNWGNERYNAAALKRFLIGDE